MKDILTNLEQNFAVSNIEKKRDDLYFINVEKKQIISVLTYLKDYAEFTHLAFLQAVDRIEENQFQLTYMLYSFQHKTNFAVRVLVKRDKAKMISIL
ncbi:MAG: NADH-quinone oxidoreductase subunit C, partial [Spirochaetes bacterium]